MTEQRELQIPFREASRISIECKCGAELTIDVRKPPPDWDKVLLQCTVCQTAFDSAVLAAMKNLTNAHAHVDDSKTKVMLRVSRLLA
jgi:hypothetical protein